MHRKGAATPPPLPGNRAGPGTDAPAEPTGCRVPAANAEAADAADPCDADRNPGRIKRPLPQDRPGSSIPTASRRMTIGACSRQRTVPQPSRPRTGRPERPRVHASKAMPGHCQEVHAARAHPAEHDHARTGPDRPAHHPRERDGGAEDGPQCPRTHTHWAQECGQPYANSARLARQREHVAPGRIRTAPPPKTHGPRQAAAVRQRPDQRTTTACRGYAAPPPIAVGRHPVRTRNGAPAAPKACGV